MSRVRRQLTFSNVCASIALFVALGGSSYALSQPHAITAAHSRANLAPAIPRGSITEKELAANSVSSKQIKNRSIELRDIAVRTRTALEAKVGGIPAAELETRAVGQSNADHALTAGAETTLASTPVGANDDKTRSFMVTASTLLSPPAGTAASGQGICSLLNIHEGTAGQVTDVLQTFNFNIGSASLPITMLGFFSLAHPSTVSLHCSVNEAGITAESPHLLAVRLFSLKVHP